MPSITCVSEKFADDLAVKKNISKSGLTLLVESITANDYTYNISVYYKCQSLHCT